MSTTETQDGNDEPVNDSQLHRTTGPHMSRRGAMKAGAGTVAALAGASAFSGSVAADDDEDEDEDAEFDFDDDGATADGASGYVGQDRGAYSMVQEDTRRAVSLGLLSSPVTGTALAAANVTDPVHGRADYVNEFLFGPFNPQDAAINEDAHNHAYHHIGDSAISFWDSLAVWDDTDYEALKLKAYAVIESETVRALNDGETRGTAKSRAKQHMREEVFETPERNIIRLAEALCVRLTGAYWGWYESLDDDTDYLHFDDDGDAQVDTDSYWSFDGEDTSETYSEYIQQFGNLQPTDFELVTGEEIRVGMAEVILADEVSYDDHDSDAYNLFPTAWGYESRFSVEPDRYGGGGSGSRSRELVDDVGFYHAGEDDYRTVDDFGSGAQRLYDELMELHDTLAEEAEDYVDMMYDEYDPGDIVDPEHRTVGSLTNESSGDWLITGDVSFTEILAALNGMQVGDHPLTIETYDEDGEVADEWTGTLIPQSSSDELPRISYGDEQYEYDEDIGEYGGVRITESVRVPGDHEFEWTDTDGETHVVEFIDLDIEEITGEDDGFEEWVAEFDEDDDAPASESDVDSHILESASPGFEVGEEYTDVFAYIALEVDDADDAEDIDAAMEVIEEEDEWAIVEVHDDSDRWFVTAETVRSDELEIDNDQLEELWDEYRELQEQLDDLDGADSGDDVFAGGLFDGGFDLDPGTAVLGIIAVILGAVGLQGALNGGDST